MVRKSPRRQLTQEWSHGFLPIVLWCVLGVVFAGMFLPGFVVAQVTTSITPDSTLPHHTVVTQTGAVHHIEAGTIRDSNQFHSFAQFDLGMGEIASFNGPPKIDNILTRVTGGIPSNIDGTLRSSIVGADLFFLNPAGVVFGSEAKLDLTGSFHVTSADFLRFEDGARLYADASLDGKVDSILTAAPLEDFGFLNNPITFGFTTHAPGSLTLEGANLQVLEGETISVVGGDITLSARNRGSDFSSSSLVAEGGVIHVASLRNAVEVPVAIEKIESNAIEHFGEISLTGEAVITTSGIRGGAVVIRGGRLVMDNSEISVSTGDVNGDPIGIDIRTENDISLHQNSRITSNALGVGHAGNIHLRTRRFTSGTAPVDVDASVELPKPRIEASTSSSGNAGDIVFNVDILEAVNTEFLSLSKGGLADSGNAGQISLEGLYIEGASRPAQQITLTNSQVDTIVTTGKGQGGNISGSAQHLVLNATGVRADGNGTGNAGNITFNVETFTGFASFLGSRSRHPNAGGGNAGNITIQGVTGHGSAAKTIAFPHNSRLTTSIIPPVGLARQYDGDGKGGQIKLIARDSISLHGSNLVTNVHNRQDVQDSAVAKVEVTAPNVTIGFGGIRATTTGSRNAGNIIVTALKKLTLSDPIGPGVPRIEAESSDQGHAGNIVFNVGELEAVNALILSSSTGTGHAGSVTIRSATQAVPGPIFFTGSAIKTEARSGRGGGIFLDGANSVTLDSTFVSANVMEGGQGGDITIQSGQRNGSADLFFQNNSLITAESTGIGDAGTIQLGPAGSLRLSGSMVSTEATRASGGNIKLTANSIIHLLNSTLESSVAGDATTQGGNISIDPQFVLVQNSHILAQANEGAGGNIDVIGNVVLVDNLSTIDTSSAFGVSGNVNISSPTQNLSGAIVPLPDDLLKVVSLFGENCFASKVGNYSSFTRRSRHVSQVPGGFLLSPLLDHPSIRVLSNFDRRSRPLPSVTRLGIDRMVSDLKTSYEEEPLPLLVQSCGGGG